MRKLYIIFCAVTLACGLTALPAEAAKPVDGDGDGYADNRDCNDSNPAIYPGAAEICDGVDNNCDGVIDEGCNGEEPEVCTDGIDNDLDGLTDCEDGDCAADPACQPTGEPEVCTDGIDNDLDGLTDCADADCAADPACQSGSAENCEDGLDNDTDGLIDCADADCNGTPECTSSVSAHLTINQYDGPSTCIACHTNAGQQMLDSVHGSWTGDTPDVTNIADRTGKWGQTNNYCTDAEMADYACLKCHVSLVAPVDAQGFVDMAKSRLSPGDMDCLQCHQNTYAATFMPDASTATDYVSCVDQVVHTYVTPVPEADGKIHKYPRFDLMPAETTMVELARTVHLPDNASCLLPCHASAGGGDGTKRGDLGSDMVDPPVAQDVHLSSAGTARLTCTSCHATTNHQIPGRGNDLRPQDTGATMVTCVDCHTGMDSGTGHTAYGRRSEPDRHVARVACTSCHVDYYGKGVGTEVGRDWTAPHWNPGGCEGQGAYVGHEVRATNLIPEFRFWNGTSLVYDRDGTAGLLPDPVDGGLAMSYPNGDVDDDTLGANGKPVNKLFPFKIHTSVNPINDATGKTNFDVLQMFMTGCYEDAAVDGLAYIGEAGSYTWKENKAFQLITHGVAPAVAADNCAKCHESTFEIGTFTKLDKVGYHLKDADKNGVVDAADKTIVCSQCHSEKNLKRDWEQMHAHVSKGVGGIGCIFCHDFDRPERGLCDPCTNPGCETEYVDNVPYDHCAP